MSEKSSHAADLQGLVRLTIDAIVGVTTMTEAIHMNILNGTAKLGPAVHEPISGVTSLVYRAIRGVTHLVGSGLDTLLDRLAPLLGKNSAWPGRGPVLATLNGVLGDYLADTANALAIPMQFRRDGQPLILETASLASAIPEHNGRLLVLVHGLCMSDRQWHWHGHDHGAALARDCGYTPLYLNYNTGLHISENGRQFAARLETLIGQWPAPVEELVILGHSMGGLVARSACHYGERAGHRWPRSLSKLVFLGTPHHGAPLERGGNWFHVITGFSAYTAPLSSLGKIRSAGITDLRYGSLLEEDWEGQDRFAQTGDKRHPVPLPSHLPCYTIAATTGKRIGDSSDLLVGDGLVPVESALGRHVRPELNLAFTPDKQWIGYEMNHLDLLSSEKVYAQLRKWLYLRAGGVD